MAFKANDSLTEQIAQYLGKKIIEGEMKPGERIQELRISSELDVSRGSVREALLILQRRHLVDIFPRRGAMVSSIGRDDVRDFFNLWFLLLDQSVALLALSWKNDDLAPFFELVAKLSECRKNDNLQEFYENGVQFLEVLYDNTPNHYLASSLKDMLPLTQRCIYAILRAGKSQQSHTLQFLEEVLRTLISRDCSKLHTMVVEFGKSYSQLAQEAASALEGDQNGFL